MIDLTHVLVATDFGKSSDNALRYGRALARRFGATLHLLHVVDDIGARGLEAEAPEFWTEAQCEAEEYAKRRLAERVSTPRGHGCVERTAMVTSSNTAEAIVEYARRLRADVIVMGTRGPTEGSAAFGSVAERVVHRAPCPVLTVKDPEDEIPEPEHQMPVTDQAV